MRICVVSLIVLTTSLQLIFATPVKSQTLDQTKISLDLKNKTLIEAFTKIESESNFHFIYRKNDVKGVNSPNISVENQSISNILKTILANTALGFKQRDSQILITADAETTTATLPEIKEPTNTSSVTAMAKTITGNVSDEAGMPLVGVSITIKGTNTTVVSSAKGDYKIVVPDNGAILVFKYIGYITQEADVNGRTVVNMMLQPDSKSLSEIVVVGYGTQKRGNVTGAISSVNSKTINELPVVSVTQALQGRVAGLTVTNNGSPGSAPIITLRGISSFNTSSEPLYVVDGFPTGSIASFDPKDIESVEVLKDASSAAIYGSRGTNGVIIITTKKSSNSQRPQVTFDDYIGIQNPIKKLDLLNTAQYLQYERAIDGAAGIGVPPRLQPANFNQPIYAGSSQTFAQTNTDWQDAYFKKNAIIQEQSVSIAGGSNGSHYYSSVGYFSQDGIAQGLGYNRLSMRINSDHKISKVFTFGENLTGSQGIQKFDATGGNRTPLTNVIRMQPYLPVYNPNNPGGFFGPVSSFDGADPTNPVEGALIGDHYNNTLKIIGNAYLNVTIAPWLVFRSSYGIDYTNALSYNYTPIYNDGGTLVSTTATIGNSRNFTTIGLNTQQLTFDKTFNKHHINAVAVYEQQNTNSRAESENGNQPNNIIRTLTGSSNQSVGYSYQENVLQSMIGRVSYDYEGRYLLNASIRRDGSSVWAPGHNYQNFPAVGVAWKVDQEKFLLNNPLVSDLKVRAGYGLTGINPSSLGNYGYLVNANSNASTYAFGNTLNTGNASYYSGTANPNLQWETTKQFDIGVDLALLQGKITFSADIYKRKTDNLILSPPTPVDDGFGGAGVNTNIGSMQNTGLDLDFGYHKNTGDFRWNINGVFSLSRNKVLALNTPTASLTAGSDPDFGGSDIVTNTVVGRSVQGYYGYVTEGIFQSAADVASHATQTGAAPGDIKFKDINGDGVINANDKAFIGSYLPKFSYSLNYSATYKNFDASIYFQGVYGDQLFDAERIITEGMARLFNASTVVLNAWTPTNTNTDVPRAISGNPNLNARISTRFVEDGSYLRLKNAIIGYTIPKSMIKVGNKLNLSSLRLYVSSQNLLTFTKYKGFDPEVGSRNGLLTNGIDYGQYPAARSFQFGLQAKF